MSDEQGSLEAEIVIQLKRVADRMDRIHHTGVELANCTVPHTAVQTTNVNAVDRARDFALWLAGTCCIVTVVLVIVGGFFYVDQMRRVDKMQDYLNAIYLQAPSLRPKT